MERVDIPLLGGPLDGREIDVEVDEDGQPPEQLAQSWLWFTYCIDNLVWCAACTAGALRQR